MAGAWFHSQMVLMTYDNGTQFTIIIDYKIPYSFIGKFLDLIYFRRRIQKAMAISIQTVKARLEGDPL